MQELLERKKGLRRSILIVDDDYIAREILGTMLKDPYSQIQPVELPPQKQSMEGAILSFYSHS